MAVNETFRQNINKPNISPRIRLTIGGTDYDEYVNGISLIRRDVNLSAGKASVTLNNAGGTFNYLKATNTALGQAASVKVYLNGDTDNMHTIMLGEIEGVRFSATKTVVDIKDHVSDLLKKKVGSGRGPINYWTVGDAWTPPKLVWELLTNPNRAGLNSLTGPGNPDIDYVSFALWRDDHCDANDYAIGARLTGQTIRNILLMICQLSHSYIWANNEGKIAFAPPFGSGYSYDESNSKPRDLPITMDKIINDIDIRWSYTPDTTGWTGYINDEDTDSKTAFGTFEHTEESRIVWHRTQASAESDAAATMTDYAFPLRFLDIKTGPYGIIEDIGNQITINDTLKSISNATPVIEEIAYDLNTWETTLKARWPW